jgi:hypothetical protein
MSTRHDNHGPKGFEVLRTPSGAVDIDAYYVKGRREQAKAVAAAFSWLNDRVSRAFRR